MIIPHHFPSLIDGPCQVIIIAGTGLSIPNAPTTDDLLPKLKTMTAALRIPPIDDFLRTARSQGQRSQGQVYTLHIIIDRQCHKMVLI